MYAVLLRPRATCDTSLPSSHHSDITVEVTAAERLQS